MDLEPNWSVQVESNYNEQTVDKLDNEIGT